MSRKRRPRIYVAMSLCCCLFTLFSQVGCASVETLHVPAPISTTGLGKQPPQVAVQAKVIQEPESIVQKAHIGVEGLASWYGKGLHNRRTASGERFDMNALTAAHRTLPFGTNVLVTNLRNGKSVIVKINDRGPRRKARVIDVSKAAAERLGFIHDGVTPIRIEILN